MKETIILIFPNYSGVLNVDFTLVKRKPPTIIVINPPITFTVTDSPSNKDASKTVTIGEKSKNVAAMAAPSISIPL